jgi:hypothetical protein
MIELLVGYFIGKNSARKKQILETKETKNMESVIVYESYSQDSRSLEQVLFKAKENARAKQNNK